VHSYIKIDLTNQFKILPSEAWASYHHLDRRIFGKRNCRVSRNWPTDGGIMECQVWMQEQGIPHIQFT
jgi:hypothetical protein